MKHTLTTGSHAGDMLAQLNQLEIQDKVGSAESLPGIDQVGKTPTHIVSLLSRSHVTLLAVK